MLEAKVNGMIWGMVISYRREHKDGRIASRAAENHLYNILADSVSS